MSEISNKYRRILSDVFSNKISLTEFIDLVFGREAKVKVNRMVENQIYDLRTFRFVDNKENVIFLGTPSVEMMHIATALGITAIEHKY